MGDILCVVSHVSQLQRRCRMPGGTPTRRGEEVIGVASSMEAPANSRL